MKWGPFGALRGGDALLTIFEDPAGRPANNQEAGKRARIDGYAISSKCVTGCPKNHGKCENVQLIAKYPPLTTANFAGRRSDERSNGAAESEFVAQNENLCDGLKGRGDLGLDY